MVEPKLVYVYLKFYRKPKTVKNAVQDVPPKISLEVTSDF